jgi:hypothetical protein
VSWRRSSGGGGAGQVQAQGAVGSEEVLPQAFLINIYVLSIRVCSIVFLEEP